MKNKDEEVSEDQVRITKLRIFEKKFSWWITRTFNIIKGNEFRRSSTIINRILKFIPEEQYLRHKFKPGITWLAQINGRNKISWEEKFKYDILYTKRRNLMDLKILFITFEK